MSKRQRDGAKPFVAIGEAKAPDTPVQPEAPNVEVIDDMVMVDGFKVRTSSILKAAAALKPPNGSTAGKPINACPICYQGYGGVGKEKWRRPSSGTLTRICYDCNACGHNWSQNVRTVKIVESRDWKVTEAAGKE